MRNTDDHNFLCAIVSLWMANGHEPVTPYKATRLIEAEVWDAQEMARTLVDREHLKWAKEPKKNWEDWEEVPDVIPTPEGLMEVLSS